MSSAKRVWPVTFARASTLRRGTPITRSLSPSAFGASAGIVRESFSSGMRPPECLSLPSPRNLRYGAFPIRDLEHCGFDGFEYLKIARAPAQVSGDCFADLIASRVRILIQQSLRGHQNCRRAIAALRRSEIGESILQWMKVTVFSEAFDCQNVLSTALECQHKTGKHRLAVEKNGASAAFSEFTAVLRAGVTEILAQDLQQSLIGREGNIGQFAVQRESYLRCLLRFDGQCVHVQSPRGNITAPMRAFFRAAEQARGRSDVVPSQRKASGEHLGLR